MNIGTPPNVAPDDRPSPALNVAPMPKTNPKSLEQVNRSRVAVVETLYFQAARSQAVSPGQKSYSRWIDSDEQPYVRFLKLDETWVPLDTGWIGDQGSQMLMENRKVRTTQGMPTPEQSEEINQCVVDVGILVKEDTTTRTMYDDKSPPPQIVFLYSIPVGETSRVPNPANLGLYRVRCRAGETQLIVNLYPM